MYGLALCAGIGGLDLGISFAVPSYRPACYVEIEAYAACVLAARMEAGDLHPAPIYSDLRTFDGRPWRGLVDVISAGYPCQPFSVAGNRKGAEDPRHLWPHVLRVVCEVEPRFVFLENVRGHLSLGFAQVLGDLAGAGFDAEWGVFPAGGPGGVGAPHRRERLFVFAHANGEGRPRRERGSSGQNPPQSGDHGKDESVANAHGGGCKVQRGGGIFNHGEERGHDPNGCRLRASSSGEAWKIEPRVGCLVDGAPYRVDRLRALGNAVVPAQAAHAFRTLAGRAGLT